MPGLKVAVSGKGGVGKTTLTVLLAREAARQGQRVLLVDADPDANAAATLGLDREPAPLAEHTALIAERTGGDTGLVRLTPFVADIPDRFAVERDGVHLVTLGAVRAGGGGCACPESSFLKGLLSHFLLERDELVLVDMEAGIEHLGRGTARGVDVLLVVIDPDRRSLDTAARIARLARDLGMKRICAVANKVTASEDQARIATGLPTELPLLAALPAWPGLRLTGASGLPQPPPELAKGVAHLLAHLHGAAQAPPPGELSH